MIYQIYPRSFADGNGDGIGDLIGVRARLPHLASLGVDAIWLSPFYPSPQADAGYDVSDYRDVDPVFGTLEDAKMLVTEAHAAGLRVVVDIVPNHTSDEHAWFQAALAAAPGSAERARYIFREGRGPTVSCRRTTGSPTSAVRPGPGSRDGQWYLHLFSPKQPDLDWTNPEVVAEFQDILRFWMERRRRRLPDRRRARPGQGPRAARHDAPGTCSAPTTAVTTRTGTATRCTRCTAAGAGSSTSSVATGSSSRRPGCPTPTGSPSTCARTNCTPAFNFDFLSAGWDADAMRAAIDLTLTELGKVGAPATWVLSNHDVTRHPTRFGRRRARPAPGKAATLLTMALPGGVYVYQGEELGLQEVLDIPGELRQDPIFFQTGGERVGRDGCRVPLPWSGIEAPFGFGPDGTPWLPQPAEWATATAEVQDGDPASTLNFYRAALALRRSDPALGDGTMNWLSSDAGLLAFSRGDRFACVVNVTDVDVAIPASLADAVVTLSSSGDEVPAGVVPANTTLWLRRAG